MRPGKQDQPFFSLSSIRLQPKLANKTVFSFKRGTSSSLGLEKVLLYFLLHSWRSKILSGDLLVFWMVTPSFQCRCVCTVTMASSLVCPPLASERAHMPASGLTRLVLRKAWPLTSTGRHDLLPVFHEISTETELKHLETCSDWTKEFYVCWIIKWNRSLAFVHLLFIILVFLCFTKVAKLIHLHK